MVLMQNHATLEFPARDSPNPSNLDIFQTPKPWFIVAWKPGYLKNWEVSVLKCVNHV